MPAPRQSRSRVWLCAAALAPMAYAALNQGPELGPGGAEGVLYRADFQGGEAPGWELGPGWQVAEHTPGQWGLRGSGHDWAGLMEGAWESYALRVRINLLRGGVHINYRVDGPRRYFVGLRPPAVYLSKQLGPEEFSPILAEAEASVGLRRWHDVEVAGIGGRLTVRVDGRQVLEYVDPAPLPGGGIAFETLEETEAYIDDVTVVSVGGRFEPPPGREGPPTEPRTEGPPTAVVAERVLTPLPLATPIETAKPLRAKLIALGDPQYTWSRTGGPLGGLGYDIRMRPDNPDLMFVTDAWAGVFASNNGGQSWYPSNGDGSRPRSITSRAGWTLDAIPVFSLTIDPHNHDIVWVGTQHRRGIFRSADGGRTWERRDQGVKEDVGISFRGFTVHPGGSEVIYAAAELSVEAWPGGKPPEKDVVTRKGVVYKSEDHGANWAPVWRGDNLARYVIINPQNPDIVYISTGIFDREAANSVRAR
ncbi:MAG: WD40/YVTN/BNR-like repeat-containing protein, partial [Armatimonadota bacterium]